jgi:hypothetical protein
MNRIRNPANHRRLPTLFATLLLVIGAPRSAAAHEHLAAGAATSAAGAALIFVNAANYAAESGYVIPMEVAESGRFAGTHHAELTLICQAIDPDLGGPAPFHPVAGTRVEAVIETVQGPTGGVFAFWEAGDPVASITAPVGQTNGTSRFPVSENDGAPDADPHGHVHGRNFSGTAPGLYRVGFRFIDTAGNGPGGGPLHPPSERFFLHFQAGITLAGITAGPAGPQLLFAAANDFLYQVESSPTLSGTVSWEPLGDPVSGDNHLHTVLAPAVDGPRFYRLRREPL